MADLITKQEYKTYAGITSINHDAEISLLIPKVSELAKTYCRRGFIDYFDQAKIETFQGDTNKFILKETPVSQIISVERSTNYGQTYTKLTKFTDWVQDEDYILPLNTEQYFPKLINGYRVTYLAGYEDVPEDLKLALLDLVTYYRKNDSAIHSTKAPGTNSVQIEYVSSTSLPAHIRRILDMYVADYT